MSAPTSDPPPSDPKEKPKEKPAPHPVDLPLAKALGWPGAPVSKGKPAAKPPPAKAEAPVPVEPPTIPLAKPAALPAPIPLPPEREGKEPKRRSRYGLAPVMPGPLPGEPVAEPETIEKLTAPLLPPPELPVVPVQFREKPSAPVLPERFLDLKSEERVPSPFDLVPRVHGPLPGEVDFPAAPAPPAAPVAETISLTAEAPVVGAAGVMPGELPGISAGEIPGAPRVSMEAPVVRTVDSPAAIPMIPVAADSVQHSTLAAFPLAAATMQAGLPEAAPVLAPLPLAPEVESWPGLQTSVGDEPFGPRVVRKAQPKLVREMPLWPVPDEVKGRRAWLATATMIVVIGLYGYFLSFFYAGAHGGVDQAGYLMTARLLSREMNPDGPKEPARPTPPEPPTTTRPATINFVWGGGATGYISGEHDQPTATQEDSGWDWLRNRLSFVPESPFQFASRMCVMTEPFGPASPDLPGQPARPANALRAGSPAAAEVPMTPGKPAEYRIYAKYPFGYSLLAAMGRDVAALFDHTQVVTVDKTAAKGAQVTKVDAVGKGFDGMYVVNPLCTVLACFFAYFMFRQAVSPFVALIGVIWLACNPLVLTYSNDANSHASTLMCVCCGFWGVISFLRTQQIWRAWVGGLALGYCCTIRYSEFLLVLPVVFAAMIHYRPTKKRVMGSLSLIAAWAIPVGVLALVCWVSFGAPNKTGYTYDHEDTGFGWGFLSGNTAEGLTQGNWNLLLGELNSTGLFIMWSLALAGLFGMLGSSWRLGGVMALWILPACVVYMMYYWSRGTTGYLRFFMSVIPGLIFCGIWLLERALTMVSAWQGTGAADADDAEAQRPNKMPSLMIGTLFGVFLLLVVAFWADGGPGADATEGGLAHTLWAFIKQTPAALAHLFTHSWLGLLWGVGIVGAMVCMWVFDRELIAGRLGIAMGAGVITALGCSINVYTTTPSLVATHARWTTLRVIVDNMRETLPRGSVVFCDDGLLQQLDCVGGWKLYDTAYFSTQMYAQSRTRVEQKNDPSRMDDPDPIQTERSRFYVELLSQQSSVSSITLGQRNQNDINQLERAVIDKNIAEGHRVTFLVLESSGSMGGGGGGLGGVSGRVQIPTFEGYVMKPLRQWTVSPDPTDPKNVAPGLTFSPGETSNTKPGPTGVEVGPVGRGGRGAGGGGRGAGRGARAGGNAGAPIVDLTPATPVPAGSLQGATYGLYEIVKR